jgi:hypothetical protein
VGGHIKNPTNTIQFIHQHEVPKEQMKDVIYGQFVCTVQPKKAEPNRMRFTVGGDRINYPGKVATPTAEMLVAKMLFNSVISTRGAQFMTINISNYYLMTPLHRPEFIHMKLSDILDKIIDEYQLRNKTTPSRSIYIVQSVLHQQRCQPVARRYRIVLVLSSWKNCTGKLKGSLPGN